MYNNLGAYSIKSIGAWEYKPPASESAIKAVNGIVWESINKINLITKENIKKLMGIEI